MRSAIGTNAVFSSLQSQVTLVLNTLVSFKCVVMYKFSHLLQVLYDCFPFFGRNTETRKAHAYTLRWIGWLHFNLRRTFFKAIRFKFMHISLKKSKLTLTRFQRIIFNAVTKWLAKNMVWIKDCGVVKPSCVILHDASASSSCIYFLIEAINWIEFHVFPIFGRRVKALSDWLWNANAVSWNVKGNLCECLYCTVK